MTAPSEGGRAELALADTSVFIAVEQERPLSAQPPERVSVSVITIGELRLGVLAAENGPTRARRLETLSAAEALDPLPVDAQVVHAWATLRLRAATRASGCRSTTRGSPPPRSLTAYRWHPRTGTMTTSLGSRSSESEHEADPP